MCFHWNWEYPNHLSSHLTRQLYWFVDAASRAPPPAVQGGGGGSILGGLGATVAQGN